MCSCRVMFCLVVFISFELSVRAARVCTAGARVSGCVGVGVPVWRHGTAGRSGRRQFTSERHGAAAFRRVEPWLAILLTLCTGNFSKQFRTVPTAYRFRFEFRVEYRSKTCEGFTVTRLIGSVGLFLNILWTLRRREVFETQSAGAGLTAAVCSTPAPRLLCFCWRIFVVNLYIRAQETLSVSMTPVDLRYWLLSFPIYQSLITL